MSIQTLIKKSKSVILEKDESEYRDNPIRLALWPLFGQSGLQFRRRCLETNSPPQVKGHLLTT